MQYRFGAFLLDVDQRRILCANMAMPMAPQVFDLLVYLIRYRARVVSRAELMDALWPDVCVSDWALSKCVARLRRALAAGDQGASVLQTLHGRGFRFVAPVEVVDLPDRDGDATAGLTDIRPGSRRRARSERRHVTVLCANVLLPRRLTRQVEDLRLEPRCHEMASHLISACGGAIVARFGTRLMACFGYPHAHRDHAGRALDAGGRLVVAIERLSETAALEAGARLTVQVGIHTGPVLIDELFLAGTSYGETVTTARALHRAAGAGSVLASDVTLRSARRQLAGAMARSAALRPTAGEQRRARPRA